MASENITTENGFGFTEAGENLMMALIRGEEPQDDGHISDTGEEVIEGEEEQGALPGDDDEDTAFPVKPAVPKEETPPASEPAKRKIKVGGEELEVTDEQLVELAQKGQDYYRKTQEVARERDELAPFQALIQQLKSDPGLNQHLASYFNRKPPEATAPPQFEDPIEQLRWEIKREVMAEIAPLLQQTVAPIRQKLTEQDIKVAVSRDPDYPAVMGILSRQLLQTEQTLGKDAAVTLFNRLDKDPSAYMQAYSQAKGLLETSRKQTTTTTENQPPPQGVVKRTDRAPILGSPGNEPPPDAGEKKKARVDKLKASALRSGNTEVFAAFLEEGGFLDHLR